MSAALECVEAHDLWFGFPSGNPVLRGLNLRALAGEITVVLGSSGGGKTTLLRLIKGVLRPTRGEVRVWGAPPAVTRWSRLDPAIGYIPQQLGLVRRASVLANTLIGAASRTGLLHTALGRFAAPEVHMAHEVLASLGIDDKASELVQTLSGGERQRVAIARSLMQRPRVLLADEFVSQLDHVTSREIMQLVRRVADAGVVVVITTHEVQLALEFADRLVVLRDGVATLDAEAADVTEVAIEAAFR